MIINLYLKHDVEIAKEDYITEFIYERCLFGVLTFEE